MGLKRMLAVGGFVAAVAAACTMGSAVVAKAADTGLKLKAGAVYMTRELVDDQIVMRQTPGGPTLVNTSALDMGWEPGLDISAGYCGESFMAEARYLGMLEWTDAAEPRVSAGGFFINNLTNNLGNNFFPAVVNVNYEYSLDSMELNLGYKPLDFLTVFVGPRWIMIDEELVDGFSIGPKLNNGAHRTTVSNDLVGGQIGVKGKVMEMDPLCLDVWAKGGYFSNSVTSKASLSDSIGELFRYADGSREDSFAAEAGLDMNVKIIEHVALSLGYQALWIENVVDAPSQQTTSAASISLTAGKTGYASPDNQLFHGGRASVVVTW